MYGAILGDILGSIYEFNNLKTEEPEKIKLLNRDCYYTDDTVLTVAVAEAILGDRDYQKAIHTWANKFPHAGYGGGFVRWIRSDNPKPYNSWGNGSAMRVSPVGWAFKTMDETLAEAKCSAEVTHNHPEGIKGAQAAAAAIFMARNSATKDDIKAYTTRQFGYNLDRRVKEIRPVYKFNESCQGTVPEAITVFLESKDFAHCMQLAISIGGDTDTLACIAGGIAEAFYKEIPKELMDLADNRIPFSMKQVVGEFRGKYSML
ncbi:MAG: ADP-ribosylglycohydrolase family protein [Hungatella sp.]|nr:ADP-ribosylglycohydrolase family protein [Hungatella sp.]